MRLHACALTCDILSYLLTNKHTSYASLCNATAVQTFLFWSYKRMTLCCRNENITFIFPQEGARENLAFKNDLFTSVTLDFTISECIKIGGECLIIKIIICSQMLFCRTFCSKSYTVWYLNIFRVHHSQGHQAQKLIW